VRGNEKNPTLQPDGEKYLTQFVAAIKLDHLRRYQFAKNITAGLYCFDIACGEGKLEDFDGRCQVCHWR
tara:strand:- start:181 stop:387 length:207 start_codon:yes stop_codon:yes gene_type:complete